MNCAEVRRHWNLYHDSEGGPELFLQINEHLAECAACARWFYQQSRLEDGIAEKLASRPPTAELWESVVRRAGLTATSSVRRWLFFSGALAVAASLFVALAVSLHFRGSKQHHLPQLTAREHERLSKGVTPLEFASRSDLEVEDYLRRRVNFPVRCPPRKDTGFIVEGAGVSKFEGEQAAYVFGYLAGRPVSVFVLPREALDQFPAQREALRRGIHRRTEGENELVIAEIDRNVVLVVGNLDARLLQRVLKAYGTYPHPFQQSAQSDQPSVRI